VLFCNVTIIGLLVVAFCCALATTFSNFSRFFHNWFCCNYCTVHVVNLQYSILIFTREYTKCTAGSTFCFVVVVVVVLGKPLIKLASISADS
jgi:hypothetical protein